MDKSIAGAVEDKVTEIRKLFIDYGQTQWNAATHGTKENLDKASEARGQWMRYWADPVAYQQFKQWDQSNAAGDDKLLARQIRLIHYGYAQSQRDSDLIDAINKLMAEIEDAYVNFRGKVDGKPQSANALDKIMAESLDSEVRQEAWEASKQIGGVVAPSIRELSRLRNQTAKKMGYPNFHRMSLELDEIDPDWLYKMLDDLAERTDEPFRDAKTRIDKQLSERYKVPVEQLRPWHFSDMFFQQVPKGGGINLDPYFADQNLEELALKTYDGIGMDVRDVIQRSDLYEREMKDQHAFCTHIDREGDVRMLCNLQPNHRWAGTLLHELGHAVYDKYLPDSIPWILREPAHTLSTEAMALLMESMITNRDWLTQIRGLSGAEVDKMITELDEYHRLELIIFARWVMVMVNFERAMYEDPERDLDTLWWDLVEKYQFVKRPEGRSAPDWAAKYHVALAPAYYQNYLLGHMMGIQWKRWLDENVGGLVNRKEAGDFFRERIFNLARTVTWNEGLEKATGEGLNIQYFVDKCSTVPIS